MRCEYLARVYEMNISDPVRLKTIPTRLGKSLITEIQRLYSVLSVRPESCRASDF